ncbi:hypothetical protein EB796_019239 [Bugula neritina]|uniref:Uncharacterized protein n=1 Tax=Bugula neritina TaxID=10212 RepID=A0A7J7J8V2_BUGNE|nr:hypothetical protein EB796_019239 [Bugula neritina]
MKCEEEEIDCMQAPTSCNKAFKLCPKEEVKLLAFLYPDVTPISRYFSISNTPRSKINYGADYIKSQQPVMISHYTSRFNIRNFRFDPARNDLTTFAALGRSKKLAPF